MRLKQKVKEGGERSAAAAKASRKPRADASTIPTIAVVTQSTEKQAFDSPVVAEVDEEVSFSPQVSLGSFVEIRRNDTSESAIVVGSGFKDRQFKMSVLTSQGEVWIVIPADCFFTIPAICPADLATRCGSDPLPVNDSELHARVEVLKRLRTLQRSVENAMAGFSRQLDSIYETVRAKHPEEWSEVTVSEIANIFRKNPTTVEVYAAHKVLMDATTRFIAGTAYATSQTLVVRPQEHVRDLLQVQQWVRDRSPVLEKFIANAKKVAEPNKLLAKETLAEQPSVQVAQHRWTETDKMIIRFLRASLRHTRSVQIDPYELSCGFIIRQFYGFVSALDHLDDSIHRMLIDIGVLPPWQDLIIPDRSHHLDQETRPAVLTQREQNILRALEQSRDPNPVHPDDFYPTDPLASIRHDWGDLPVYVIDDVTAEELDDGISVERIPSDPEHTWVHIHVADASSLIPPTNFLAQQAAQQHESWYLVPRSFPLFPRCITHHPTRGLSLGIRSKNGQGDNVMTFSVKVDSHANIVDYNIRAGLIRNVKLIDYDSLNVKLDPEHGSDYDYPFSTVPDRPPFQDLDPRTTEDMKLLTKTGRQQTRKRLDMNWFSFDRTKGTVGRVSDFPVHNSAYSKIPRSYRGFPELTYAVTSTKRESERGSRSTVAEMMKLACRAASLFFTKKGVPALRRCSDAMVPATEKAIEDILNARDELGYIPEAEFLNTVIYAPSARYKLEPGMHWGLGVPNGEGYVRVTSPLRRYGDLVAHWQIQQILLQEKDGREVKGAFSADWLANFAGTMEMKDQHIKGTQRRHQRFWRLLFIERWRNMFGGGKNRELWPKDANGQPIEDPLHNLEGYAVMLPKINRLTQTLQMPIQVPKLGLKEFLMGIPLEEYENWSLGMKVPVQVQSIRLGTKPSMELSLDRARLSG
ncbi:Exoribonuclease II, mitochondrial [Leucoagaricus sp. SymC.cos]|nr:Exoribonuclease II, mitochondrial [Leucoagaricus sp. SymC.cos]